MAELAVNAWVEQYEGCSTAELLRAFEAVFAALWQRTRLTLGELTLRPIVERVLHTAKQHYPLLAPFEGTTSAIRCDRLCAQEGLRHGDLAEAIRFVLTELLTVLSNLTGHILTPALHAELSSHHAVAADRATATSSSTSCGTRPT